jgi:putative phage-type endonuclease
MATGSILLIISAKKKLKIILSSPLMIYGIIDNYYKEYLQEPVLWHWEIEELVLLLTIAYGQKISPQLVTDYLKNKGVLIAPSPTSDQKLSSLRSRELTGDQRSTAWLQQRHEYITASVSAACAGLMGPVARRNQILEKATYGDFRSFVGNYYTDMGNIFEQVTNSYYENINYCRIHEFNLIPSDDTRYPFLGASTDGVSSTLRNIEIKSLMGRKLDDNKVKKEYYHQMQHQMFCLGLEKTDFIEVVYKQWSSLGEALVQAQNTKPFGIIIELWNPKNSCHVYEYSDQNIDNLQEWEKHRALKIASYRDLLYLRSIYWTMDGYLCRQIDRDPKWIDTMGPELCKFWDEVKTLRGDSNALQSLIINHMSSRKQKTTGPDLAMCFQDN